MQSKSQKQVLQTLMADDRMSGWRQKAIVRHLAERGPMTTNELTDVIYGSEKDDDLASATHESCAALKRRGVLTTGRRHIVNLYGKARSVYEWCLVAVESQPKTQVSPNPIGAWTRYGDSQVQVMDYLREKGPRSTMDVAKDMYFASSTIPIDSAKLIEDAGLMFDARAWAYAVLCRLERRGRVTRFKSNKRNVSHIWSIVK